MSAALVADFIRPAPRYANAFKPSLKVFPVELQAYKRLIVLDVAVVLLLELLTANDVNLDGIKGATGASSVLLVIVHRD